MTCKILEKHKMGHENSITFLQKKINTGKLITVLFQELITFSAIFGNVNLKHTPSSLLIQVISPSSMSTKFRTI